MHELIDPGELRQTFLERYPVESKESLEIEEERVFTWKITDWSQLTLQVESPAFELGGQQWAMLLHPQGSEGSRSSISLFLKRLSPESLADKCVEFVIIMHSPEDESVYTVQRTKKRFTKTTLDWGYKIFTDLRGAMVPAEGAKSSLIYKNATNFTIILRSFVDPTGILWMDDFSDYDSRAQTGMVGLMNQGATCYLNSLLQSLYFTKIFRGVVYELPDGDEVTDSLQSLFYLLKSSPHPVSTLPLTRSFGWDTADAFTQHDVQELNRVLMDKLETCLKGTPIEGVLNNIFVGQMRSYIKCVNVDFESSRVEDFWDIQLNVKGMNNVYDSFDNYVEVEMLTGENQYSSSEFGLQDAQKGVIFEKLPPVLHLQLKRYDYDFMQDVEIKINDYYEFPMELDLNKYVATPGKEPYIYDLYGVLVHSGDLNAGHYYALLKPDLDSDWFTFDDDRVLKATQREVLDLNYGGNGRISSAYMLVYIQRSRAEFVLPRAKEVVPEHICERVKAQQREDEAFRQEQIEQQQTIPVQISCSDMYVGHDDIGINQTNEHAQGCLIRFKREMPIRDTIPLIQTTLGFKQPPTLWLLVGSDGRANTSMIYIHDRYLNAPTDSLAQWSNSTHPALWAEENPGDPDTHFLVFLKEFDGKKLTLKGTSWISKTASANEIAGENTRAYYEYRGGEIVPFNKPLAGDTSNVSGTTIVIDKSNGSPDAIESHYLELRRKVTLLCSRRIGEMEQISEDEEVDSSIQLTASMNDTYEQLSGRLGAELNVPPENIIIFPYHLLRTSYNYNGKWCQRPALRSDGSNLRELWRSSFGDRTFHLAYDVLSQPLKDFEKLSTINIYWYPDGVINEAVEPISLLVAQDSLVQDVVKDQLKTLDAPEASGKLKIWASSDLHSIATEVELKTVKELSEFRQEVYVSPLSKAELEIRNSPQKEDQPPKLVLVYHYSRDPRRSHGVPFEVPLNPAETLGDLKEKLQKITGLHGKTFEKVKISHESRSSMSQALTDNDEIIYDLIAEGDAIGLDHPDRRRSVFPQQSIVIK